MADDAARLAEMAEVMESDWDHLTDREVRELLALAQRQQRQLAEASEALEYVTYLEYMTNPGTEDCAAWAELVTPVSWDAVRDALRSLLSEVRDDAK